jgi:hypothetical protein
MFRTTGAAELDDQAAQSAARQSSITNQQHRCLSKLEYTDLARGHLDSADHIAQLSADS